MLVIPGDAVDHLQMLGPKPANHLEMLQAQNSRDSAVLHGMAGICTAPRQVYSWLLFVYIVNKSNKITKNKIKIIVQPCHGNDLIRQGPSVRAFKNRCD